MAESNFSPDSSFARNHVTITPSDANNLDRDMAIYCGSAGDITVLDKDGESVTYTVVAGDILPVVARKVMATGTDVTQVIGLY